MSQAAAEAAAVVAEGEAAEAVAAEQAVAEEGAVAVAEEEAVAVAVAVVEAVERWRARAPLAGRSSCSRSRFPSQP
jgi:hypothetical protein